MIRRFLRTLLTMASLVLLAGAITFLYLGWRINHTGLHDRAQPADAIVVLGAQVMPDGKPGPDLWVRTLHAVDLWHRGLAPTLICTGGYHDDRLSAAAVARELAIVQGVPADKVLIADGSMTTREDAASARDLMIARGWDTAILVSHPLHLERARILFEAEGMTGYPSPTNTDLAAIPWSTRVYLTAREAVGITWITLEALGIPYDWTIPLSRLVYGSEPAPEPHP
ncbi:MAG: YdcF family protein [Anaerolineae bacterium]|nr:YdcF family protein [Anaerolineae bacterium]